MKDGIEVRTPIRPIFALASYEMERVGAVERLLLVLIS